jgi:hypothetical protein
MRNFASWWGGAALGAVFAISLSLGHVAGAADRGDLPFQGLYLLNFNRWGELLSEAERDLAINELRENREVDRILIFSYGWANDGEASYATYRRILGDLASQARSVDWAAHTAVIAVGWDSSQTGFRKFFNDVIALPGIADALAWIPDHVLFPLSFWSKAAQADRIGFGGLRTALNQIFEAINEDRDPPPEILLMGHSFGTRILSGLMRNNLGIVPVFSEKFIAADQVKGAVLLQPALILANLDDEANYPVLVTMSEHDHANGFLFPIANIPLNAYSLTLFEALIRHQIFGRVESTLEMTVNTVTDIVTAPLPGSGKQQKGEADPEPEPEPDTPSIKTITTRTVYIARRTLAELVSIPASIAFTLAVTPIGYGYGQFRAFTTHPVNQVMDSLAQLPVVEVLVAGLDHALGREIPWGRRGKGIFSLGPLHESVGRLLTPAVIAQERPPVYTSEELFEFESGPEGCGLPVCSGILIVDASELIYHSAYGPSLKTEFANFTLGWLDPIGAHGDYRTRKVARLMALITARDNRPESK